MDAVEFLKEAVRMCDTDRRENPEGVVAAVEKVCRGKSQSHAAGKVFAGMPGGHAGCRWLAVYHALPDQQTGARCQNERLLRLGL